MSCHSKMDTPADRIAALIGAIRRIEELATDTPTKVTEIEALDAIREECERILSEFH